MPRRFYIPLNEPARIGRRISGNPRTRFIILGAVLIPVVIAVMWYVLDVRFPNTAKSDNFSVHANAHVGYPESSVDDDDIAAPQKDTSAISMISALAAATADKHEPIRIQVLNGCGVRGIAKLVSPALRAKGFDVRETRNAGSFRYARSQVFDRIGQLENAWIVADSLGIDRTLAATQIARNLTDVDVTLIVGADFEQLKLNSK